MPNTTGKLIEKMLEPRLLAFVYAEGDLSEKQYGFRKRRSTIHAVQEVVDTIARVAEESCYTRKTVLLATLGVRNAFDSAR